MAMISRCLWVEVSLNRVIMFSSIAMAFGIDSQAVGKNIILIGKQIFSRINNMRARWLRGLISAPRSGGPRFESRRRQLFSCMHMRGK